MRRRKLFTKEKAKNGEGRKATIKHLLLPEEVVQELKLFKDAYSVCLSREKDEWGNPLPVRVSWEQMFRRWMDNVGRFDKDVKEYVESGKAYLAANPPAPAFPVDPTEGEVWNMRYFAVKDGEEIELQVGDKQPFYGKFNGKDVGLWKFLQEDYTFMNDAGVEITEDQAKIISEKIKKHHRK